MHPDVIHRSTLGQGDQPQIYRRSVKPSHSTFTMKTTSNWKVPLQAQLRKRRDIHLGSNRSNETPRLFTQTENSQEDKTHTKPSDIQDRAQNGQDYGFTGVLQKNTQAHEVKEYGNTGKWNTPPGGAEVPHNGKTYTMRFKVDVTAAIRRLIFLLVPHYIFKLFNILRQKLKRKSSVFHNKCDTDLPNNGCSDQTSNNQDIINSVENKKSKCVDTKLIQHQSVTHGVQNKDKNLAQLQPAPRQNAPEDPAVNVEQVSKVEIPTILKENVRAYGDEVRRKKILRDSTNNYEKHCEQKTIAESTENHSPSEAKGDVVRQIPKKNMLRETCEDMCPLKQSALFPAVSTFVKVNSRLQRKNQQRLGSLLRVKRSRTVTRTKTLQRVLTINNHQTGTYQQRGLKVSKLRREVYQHRVVKKLQRRKDLQRANKMNKYQRKTHMPRELKIAKFRRKIDQQRELRICKFLKRMHQQRQLNMSKFEERLYQQRVLKCIKLQRIIYLQKELKISKFQRRIHQKVLQISKFLNRIYQQQVAKAKFQRRNLKRKAKRLQHKRTMASSNQCSSVSRSMWNSTTTHDNTVSSSMKSSINTMWDTSSHDHRASSSVTSSIRTMWGTSCFDDNSDSNSVWASQWGATSNHSNRAFSSVHYNTNSSNTWSSHIAATRVTPTSMTPALSFSPGAQVKSKAGISQQSTPQKAGGLYYCPHCSHAEKYLNTLYTHIRKEHTGSLECGVCGKEYNSAQGLKQHMKNKH